MQKFWLSNLDFDKIKNIIIKYEPLKYDINCQKNVENCKHYFAGHNRNAQHTLAFVEDATTLSMNLFTNTDIKESAEETDVILIG